MDAILAAHNTLERKANLSKTLADVSSLIDSLQTARDAVESSPELSTLHLAKLKAPVKSAFEAIEEDLKEVNKGLNQYQKALTTKWKNAALPSAVNGALGERPELVDRAVAMHLLREGMFGVAGTFVREVNERQAQERERKEQDGEDDEIDVDGEGHDAEGALGSESLKTWIRDFAQDGAVVEDDEDMDGAGSAPDGSGQLQKRFSEMYHILDALRNQHDLGPAIEWSRAHSSELEARGSNLEFELARLKFVELYTSSLADTTADDSDSDSDSAIYTGPLAALDCARATFPAFTNRYTPESASLLGSLAFAPSLATSPYASTFHNPSTWTDISQAFTLDFCSLLGLSPTSPLRTAVTAGGIALPTLSKVEKIMAQSRGQWTSVNELPVETPLPPGYSFHSIFVCPVSKEQATDANPPMLLPCGHVIARESLEGHARGKSRMKCPYCPGESSPREARRVYI